MSGWKLSNFANSTLSQAILDSDTTIYIDADEVDLLPALGVGDKAKGILYNSAYREIVNITAWTTDGTLTIERGKELTAARSWPAGTKFTHTPTAEVLQAVLDATVQAVYRGTATGANDITVTTAGSIPAPADGDEVSFEVVNSNTGPVTLTYTNGSSTIGPFDVVKEDGTPLRAGELMAGYRVKVVYDAAAGDWILVNQASKRYDIMSINTGPLEAGNQLPNGSFDAWNNATTFATPASGSETADNVVVEYDGTIGAFTVSRQTFTLGQTDVEGGPKYYLRWDQSSAGAASSFRRIRMRVPHVNKYALELVIASIYLKADVGRNVTASLIQSFGTGGVPSAEVVLASEVCALTTDWVRFDLTDTVNSITGKTLGSAGDDGLILELSLPVNTSMAIDVAMGQFEFGDVASRTHSRLPWPWPAGGTGGSFDSATDFINTLFPDIGAIEALVGTSGLLAKTAANTWALRNLAVGTGLTVTNPAGIAGNPTVGLDTALTNYVADPLSIAELASVTGAFGTAAFVADSDLVHIAGTETLSGRKNFVNTGLWINDTDASHSLNIKPGSNLTADRTFTLTTGDANRTLDISAANVTISTQGSQLIDDTSFSAMRTTMGVPSDTDPSISGSITLGSTFPIFRFIDSSAVANSARWRIWAIGTDFRLQTLSDDEVTATTAMNILRSGSTVTSVNFPSSDVIFSSMIPTSVVSAGYRGVPNNSGDKSGAYSTAGRDSGAAIPFTAAATLTISTNAAIPVPIGTVIMIPSLAGGGNITVHPDTGVTLRRGDGTAGTGDRIVSANSAAWIWKRGTDEWYIFGLFT